MSSSSSIPDDLRAALEALPLFPLQQAVLFPGTLLPLHVFEPRYKALVCDVLSTHRTLAMAHVPSFDADMRGNPEISEIAGLGTIVEHAELPGGRFNVVLRGRARVRLAELPHQEPYRRATATLLASEERPIPPLELASLHAAAAGFAELVRQRDPSFRLRLPRDVDGGGLADVLANQLVLDGRERQRVLECLDVRARVVCVTEILTVQRATLQLDHGDVN